MIDLDIDQLATVTGGQHTDPIQPQLPIPWPRNPKTDPIDPSPRPDFPRPQPENPRNPLPLPIPPNPYPGLGTA